MKSYILVAAMTSLLFATPSYAQVEPATAAKSAQANKLPTRATALHSNSSVRGSYGMLGTQEKSSPIVDRAPPAQPGAW